MWISYSDVFFKKAHLSDAATDLKRNMENRDLSSPKLKQRLFWITWANFFKKRMNEVKGNNKKDKQEQKKEEEEENERKIKKDEKSNCSKKTLYAKVSK